MSPEGYSLITHPTACLLVLLSHDPFDKRQLKDFCDISRCSVPGADRPAQLITELQRLKHLESGLVLALKTNKGISRTVRP